MSTYDATEASERLRQEFEEFQLQYANASQEWGLIDPTSESERSDESGPSR